MKMLQGFISFYAKKSLMRNSIFSTGPSNQCQHWPNPFQQSLSYSFSSQSLLICLSPSPDPPVPAGSTVIPSA